MTINRPLQIRAFRFLQTFTNCIKNKSKNCESQSRSLAHRFTGKSKQNLSGIHAKRLYDILVLQLFVAQISKLSARKQQRHINTYDATLVIVTKALGDLNCLDMN